jgi:hypothetical protein
MMHRQAQSDIAAAPVRYAWSSITEGTRNYGNYFIEWSLKQLLSLPEADVVFDSFKPLGQSQIERINQTCQFVINPGCTSLQPGENAAFEAFERIKVPRPCFGGCLWEYGHQTKFTQALRTVGPVRFAMRAKRGKTPKLTIARQMSRPIGSRDPYTHEMLQAGGIESILTGCPTLLSPQPVREWKPVEGRRLAVSLSRYALPMQLRLIRRLRKSWNIRILIHEDYEKYAVQWLDNVEVVEFESVEQFFACYRDSDAVLTGRLHGALPAIRYGRPVVFFGNAGDTRFSLLRYLGLPIRPLSLELAELGTFPEITRPDPAVYQQVHTLARNWVSYCRTYDIPCNLEI